MEKGTYVPEKFSTPEEEQQYLASRLLKRRRENTGKPETTPDNTIREELKLYTQEKGENILHPEYQIPESEARAITLELAPEPHDEKMNELLGILMEKGIHNALTVVEKLGDPHLADDFHRFLVQYLKSGFASEGLKEKDPLLRSLKISLFEILLPEVNATEQNEKPLKEIISAMEQFYAGMLSVGDGGTRANIFAMEIAVANHSDDFVFYAAVPDEKRNLFEKHIFSIFPDAKIIEQKNDYNIFNEAGGSVASYAKLKQNPIFPIKTYDKFSFDPINAVLNSFSKIDRDGEGAAIQIIFNPAGDYFVEKFKYALSQLHKGVKLEKAIDIPFTFTEHVGKAITDIMFTAVKKEDKKAPKEEKLSPKDEIAAGEIKEKISTPILSANIRLVASAESVEKAGAILSDIESAFNQFENTQGNRFTFERLSGRRVQSFLEEFTYRTYTDSYRLPLSLAELATIMHLPSTGKISTSQVKLSKAGTAPAPLDLPGAGTRLGTNSDRGKDTPIYMTEEDRLRHFYTIGQTGTGKTNLLKNMAVQDILRGDGICFIDPHGSDIEDILAAIPPERAEDVIYFDPAYTERPMGLNMLEYDIKYPEQKTFVVNELFSIFRKLYGAVPESMGPAFEQYFRNATQLVLEDPESGCTLLEVSRVLSDKAFRDLKISKCKNPLIVQFWRDIAEKAGGEASLQNMVPYVTNKFDVFLANDIMRPIVGQEKSAFNFREVMDGKKILLVNLSKGRLGDVNANLLGLIIVGKILMASLSRVDSMGQNLPPFYLYIDEFQNITTDSISTIFSEARKYKLSLSVAHQYIGQLEDHIKNSVFGNVGSLAVFRTGQEDAEYLERQLTPVFSAKDIANLDNYHAYVKLLVHGRPVRPFSIKTDMPTKGDRERGQTIKQLSRLTFGRSREDVEEEIMGKYRK